MITHDQLIQFCQELDGLKNDRDIIKFHPFSEVRDNEIISLLLCWINPIGNDDTLQAEMLITNLLENRTSYEFIESRKWEQYKGSIMRVYRHYDMNGFYYLCRDIWYYYVKQKYVSIEEMFVNIIDKYYHETICRLFGGNSQIQNEKSIGACANLNMMMKYLVHDLKLWQQIDKSKLIIPLTYKIITAAEDLLILNNTSNTLANAKRVTEFGKDLLGDDFMKLYAGLIYHYHNKLNKKLWNK